MSALLLHDPAEVTEAGEARVGGKAMGLARLATAGARVPPFAAVPVEAFRAHLDACGLTARLDALCDALADLPPEAPDTAARVAELAAPLQEAVAATTAPPGLADALVGTLEALGEGPWAVRSSMVGEDSATHSFAGQLESYLFQPDAAAVADAVVRCWASCLAGRVLAYRLRAGDASPPRMGVVVQQMIDAEVAGVVFTAHPVTGRRDHVLVTAAWGQGEGVVGGLCNTDELVWSAAEGELSCDVALKDLQVVRAPDGAPGTVEAAVPEGRQRVRCLAPDQAAEVARTCHEVAVTFGAPQDIEFAVAGGALYLLQARPITSLPVPVNTDGPRLVFDNSNIQESYCGVTTPLTFSFASAGYASVYAQTMRALGLGEDVIRDHDDMLRNMLGLVRGRVYYNINNWYRGLLLLPSFGRNKADMEQMMGLDEPVDFVVDEHLDLGAKLRRIPRLLRTVTRLLRHFRTLPREVPRWQAAFAAAYARADRSRFPAATMAELMDVLALLRREMLDNWSTPILNDFFVMTSVGQLRRLVDGSGAPQPTALLAALMAGEDGIESTEPVRQLMTLARDARAAGDVAETLAAGAPEDALAAVAERHPAFAARIDAWLERYGDRSMGELKLETISLREDPTFVVQVLRNYLDRPDLDPAALARREKAQRADAEATLRQHLGWLGRWRMTGVLRKARQSVKQREAMRLERTRMFGLFRDAYRAIGERLHEAGRLDAPRDVFYLTTAEIDAYAEGRAVSAELGGLARARRAEFEAYEDQDLPHRFETVGPVYHGNRYAGPAREVDTDARTLHGIGCYPGVVESTLKVVHSPRDELSVNGRILTTVRTDPGWAPLFPTCGGLLIERGSTLSHSAVIARELGIPAVVGVAGLLDVVEDGEAVRLDGGAGTVVRLDAPDETGATPEEDAA